MGDSTRSDKRAHGVLLERRHIRDARKLRRLIEHRVEWNNGVVTYEIEPVRADEAERFGSQFGPDVDHPRRRRTVVALNTSAIVGACSAMWSTWHPDFGFADIYVERGHRRRGVGRRLLRSLEERANGPLMFNAESGAAGLSEFLTAEGYRRSTTSTTVDVDIITAADVTASWSAPSGVSIHHEPMSDEIERLFEVIYAEHHTWAGSYRSVPERTWITRAGRPIEPSVFVARMGQVPVAAVCAVTGEFSMGVDAFVPPTGVVADAPRADTNGVIAALLRASLDALFRSGAETARIECDSTYTDLSTAMSVIGGRVVDERACWQR